MFKVPGLEPRFSERIFSRLGLGRSEKVDFQGFHIWNLGFAGLETWLLQGFQVWNLLGGSGGLSN